MKTIKLKNATLELSAEDIAELRKQLEEPKSWPEVGDDYWEWNSFAWMPNSCMWEEDEYEKDSLARGELFRTKEECEEDDKKRRALVRIKEFIRKEKLELPDDYNGERFVFYCRDNHIEIRGGITDVFLDLLQFSSKLDAEWVKQIHEADLKILFNIR